MRRRVSSKVIRKVNNLPDDAPIKQVLLDALDVGWTLPALATAAGLTASTLYAIIQKPYGDARGDTVRRLRVAVSTSTPPA
jgi:AraC-like DNA-binding protein